MFVVIESDVGYRQRREIELARRKDLDRLLRMERLDPFDALLVQLVASQPTKTAGYWATVNRAPLEIGFRTRAEREELKVIARRRLDGLIRRRKLDRHHRIWVRIPVENTRALEFQRQQDEEYRELLRRLPEPNI